MEEKKEEIKKKGGRPKGSKNSKNQTILEQIDSDATKIAEFSNLEYYNELKRINDDSIALKQVAKESAESRLGIYSTIKVLFKLLESSGEKIEDIKDFFNELYPTKTENINEKKEEQLDEKN
ncbi:MAG: hypothetical protein ACLUD1_12535 [Clostridia bacterium]